MKEIDNKNLHWYDRKAVIEILDELMSDLDLKDLATHGVSTFTGPNLREFIEGNELELGGLTEWLLSWEMRLDNYPLCKRCNEDKEWAWGLVDDEEFRSQQPESWLALHGDSPRQLKIKFMQLWGGDVDGGGTGHFVMPGEVEGCGITACTCGCGNRETGPSFFRVVD